MSLFFSDDMTAPGCSMATAAAATATTTAAATTAATNNNLSINKKDTNSAIKVTDNNSHLFNYYHD